MSQAKRHTGVDLMRIVCMLAIVLYHIQGHGELIVNTHLDTANRVLIIALQTLYQAAVSGYALISGYVGYASKHRYSSLVLLWLRVLVYSVGITGALWLLSPASVGSSEIRSAFLPLLTGQYWYFTAYAGCFFLSPLVRASIERLSKKEGGLYLGGALLCFSVLPYLLRNDPFYTSGGNHALWLTLLYAVGAYVRKHDPFECFSTKKLLLLLGCACAVQISASAVLKQVSLLLTGKGTTIWYFVRHDSPTTLVLAVLLFALFTRIRLPMPGTLFRMLAASSFSVYLIHDHPLVRRHIIAPLGARLAALPAPLVIPAVFACGAAIYLLCTLVDQLREAVFRRLHIQERLVRAEDRMLSRLHTDAD